MDKSDHDLLTEMHTVLLGTNGHPGLCRQVERNTKDIVKLWIILAVLVATAGGGVYGLLDILSKLN